MPDLSDFQDAFTAALSGRSTALSSWWDDVERGETGLAVYRNTIAAGEIDALVGGYPTVERMVGSEWFRAAALLYTRERPPRRASLLSYGDDFSEWLEGFAPAADLPYLPAVARLDRMWLEAHLAADAPVAPAEAFAAGPEAFLKLRAELHPATRFAVFDHNAAELWRMTRSPADPGELEFRPESAGVLIVRPAGAVEVRPLAPAGAAFLEACVRAEPLAEAAAAAAQAQPDADLRETFAGLIASGAFSAVRRLPLDKD